MDDTSFFLPRAHDVAFNEQLDSDIHHITGGWTDRLAASAGAVQPRGEIALPTESAGSAPTWTPRGRCSSWRLWVT